MADNSEPRSAFILQMGLFSIVSLVGIRYGLVSYFDVQMDEEYMRKTGGQKHEQLERLRADERKLLTGGPMPIDRAMAMMAQQGRERMLAPKASDDLAPMQGWTQSPNPHAPSATPDVATGDGGVQTGTGADGGIQTGTGGDGGVRGSAGDAGAPIAKDAGASATGTRDAGR